MRSLTDLGCALATYGGFSYLVSQPFWAVWVVSIKLDFPMRGVLFMYTIIHNYSMEVQYSFIHSCDSVSFLLSIFPVYACENYLSRKIFVLCFFLKSLLIAFELLVIQSLEKSTLLGNTCGPQYYVWSLSWKGIHWEALSLIYTHLTLSSSHEREI